MGEYFNIVCHRCRVRMKPSLLKLGEIRLNESIAAEVGRFCCDHPGHPIELAGDEYNHSDNEVFEYKVVEATKRGEE